MFDDLLESSSSRRPKAKRWTFFVSVALQAAILAVLVVLPLLFIEPLPHEYLQTILVAPPPPPPPPPPAAPTRVVRVRPVIRLNQLVAPVVIPRHIEVVHDQPAAPNIGVAGGVDGGVAGGIAGGVLGGTGTVPPPPPPAPATPSRIRVGGNVIAAKLVQRVVPVYPQIAQTAHVEGTVVLHAIVSRDGTVEQLQYVSGPPLLMQAAMKAVLQWRYEPTYLNGQPVEVDTTIQVVFRLSGGGN